MKGLQEWARLAVFTGALGACDGDKGTDTAEGYPSDTAGAETADASIATGDDPGCVNLELAQASELTALLATLEEGPEGVYFGCSGELSVNDGEGIPATASELEGSQRWEGMTVPLNAGTNTLCINLDSENCASGNYQFQIQGPDSITVESATFGGDYPVNFQRINL